MRLFLNWLKLHRIRIVSFSCLSFPFNRVTSYQMTVIGARTAFCKFAFGSNSELKLEVLALNVSKTSSSLIISGAALADQIKYACSLFP